jgi:hypothetical protein
MSDFVALSRVAPGGVSLKGDSDVMSMCVSQNVISECSDQVGPQEGASPESKEQSETEVLLGCVTRLGIDRFWNKSDSVAAKIELLDHTKDATLKSDAHDADMQLG